MMTALAWWSLAIGVAHLLAAAALLAAPDGTRAVLKAFPRHAWAGRILAAGCLAWSAILVNEMPLEWFDAYKDGLWVAAPVIYILIILFMADLLAARALGGLLLLMADPILESALFQPSPFRLVVVVLAYAWVIAGMALVLAPYRLRLAAEAVLGKPAGTRVCGVIAAGLGALLVGLGGWVFKGG